MKTLALAALVLPLVAAAAAFCGDPKKEGHPHFDDGGALRWFTKLADAEAAAKKEGKLVFIEYGREK
jgi:hypothetical protein